MTYILIASAMICASFSLMTTALTRAREARKRIWGLKFIVALRAALEHIPKHRGMANAYLKGDPSFKSALIDLQRQIDQDLLEIERMAEIAPLKDTRIDTQAVARKWRDLKTNALTRLPDESFTIHTRLVEDVLYLMEDVSEDMHVEQGVLRDDRLLMESLVKGIPVITETIGQARGIGTGVVAQRACDVASRIKLKFLNKRIGSVLEERLHPIQPVLAANLPAAVAPGGIFDTCLKSTDYFLTGIKNELLHTDTITISADEFYGLGTRAIEANFRLFDELAPVMEATMAAQQRRQIRQAVVTSMGGAAVCVATAITLFHAI